MHPAARSHGRRSQTTHHGTPARYATRPTISSSARIAIETTYVLSEVPTSLIVVTKFGHRFYILCIDIAQQYVKRKIGHSIKQDAASLKILSPVLVSKSVDQTSRTHSPIVIRAMMQSTTLLASDNLSRRCGNLAKSANRTNIVSSCSLHEFGRISRTSSVSTVRASLTGGEM
jgi:hypothetical protein